MPSVRRRDKPDAIVETTVERIGVRGDGIGHWQGETIYLPFTVAGDHVRARLGNNRGDGYEARVVERHADGAGRTEPPCPHFGRCGGCALQHLDGNLYEAVKLGFLRDALGRVGIDPGVVQPLRRVATAARRRARLGLHRPKNPAAPPLVGFRERFSHTLIDIRACLVLEPALFALIEPLRRYATVLLSPGSAAEAMLTHTDSGVDLLIEAAGTPGLAILETLARFADEQDLARIVWRSQNGDTPIVERRPPRLTIGGIEVRVPPGAFLQASVEAEEILVGEATAAIGDRRPVLDLFAGLGTFTFALATVAPARNEPVHAIDGDAAAVAALGRAATTVPNITVERRDLARDPVPAEALDRWSAALFDPPRAGALAQADALAHSRLDTVVAISCNPATFARDAGRLVAGGFRVERILPVDQFVWSPHLELAAVFRR